MNVEIAGVLPIAHTPFLASDDIDYASLERQIDWAFQVGAQGALGDILIATPVIEVGHPHPGSQHGKARKTGVMIDLLGCGIRARLIKNHIEMFGCHFQ